MSSAVTHSGVPGGTTIEELSPMAAGAARLLRTMIRFRHQDRRGTKKAGLPPGQAHQTINQIQHGYELAQETVYVVASSIGYRLIERRVMRYINDDPPPANTPRLLPSLAPISADPGLERRERP